MSAVPGVKFKTEHHRQQPTYHQQCSGSDDHQGPRKSNRPETRGKGNRGQEINTAGCSHHQPVCLCLRSALARQVLIRFFYVVCFAPRSFKSSTPQQSSAFLYHIRISPPSSPADRLIVGRSFGNGCDVVSYADMFVDHRISRSYLGKDNDALGLQNTSSDSATTS